MKKITLLRGIPGGGKSTTAKMLFGENVPFLEADQYFMIDGEYKFDVTKLSSAHKDCQSRTEQLMIEDVDHIVVANTFTQEWEMKPYYELAEKYGYMVFSLIVENRHGGKNVHNVPEETLEKMRKRFEIKL
jgi:predicted kinase